MEQAKREVKWIFLVDEHWGHTFSTFSLSAVQYLF